MPDNADKTTSNQESARYVAFIIMPFGTGDHEKISLRRIYEHFKAKLAESGFDARRADDIPSENIIMNDIIQAIRAANIIVAELTGGNPNVMYELAIAHSLDKPVISLTQDPEDDLPFDIAPLSVTKYSRDFAEMQFAEDAIRLGCTAYVAGNSAYFGNPISSHFGRHILALEDANDTDIEPGILDHSAELDEGGTAMAVIFTELAQDQSDLTEHIKEATGRLGRARSVHQQRVVCQQLAVRTNKSADLIAAHNKPYQDIIDAQEISLTSLLQSSIIDSQDNFDSTQELIKTLEDLIGTIVTTRGQIADYKATLDNLPSIEQDFNRARQRLASAIGELISLFTRHKTVIGKGVGVAQNRLATWNPDSST